MKKIVWGSILVAIVSFIVWSKDPLNEAVNFIIAGSVPGTNISIGLWSTLLLAVFLLWVVSRGFKRTKLQMLEHTAHEIKKTQAETEFKETYSGDFDRSKRSVIAAPRSTDAAL